MPLSSGTNLGPYEILASIGAGGMGEVYRARDAKLKRDVAIKVLPATLARDPDRLARFEREARLMASLDHPNIGIIYGIEESNHTLALVLALIEGPTLADRIATGPIPVDEAIHIAGQIAEALEYAHDRNVIHRDLKPANVKITPEGVVKVLDFGLAKALTGEPEAASSPTNSPAMSPTLTMRATQAGMILGTAAYMAPEQAKGKTADRRADIWAFGVVFFEMLTGEPLFTGDSAAEIMASAIKEEPNLNRLPKSTPPAIRRLIERCLNKDPKQRLQAIGEARITLRSPNANAEPAAVAAAALPAVQAASKKSLLSWIIAAAAIVALATLAWIHFREVPPVERSLRFQIAPPDKAPIGAFRLSPDGRYLAFVSGAKVWVRPLNSLESKVLDGTEGATYVFWSPDSENLAFFSGGKLKRILRTGGPVETLCDVATGRGGTWNRDGVILFSPGPTATLFRVSAAGGVPFPVTKFSGSSTNQGNRFPEFLPDGQHFLYVAQSDKSEDTGLYLGGLDGSKRRLFPEQSSAIFAAGPPGQSYGYILFRRQDTLMAQPFDAARLQFAGDVFPVSDRVGQAVGANTGYGAFSISADGTLVMGSGASGNRQLVWFDRAGKRLAPASEAGNLAPLSFSISPDGKKLAYVTGNSEEATVWLQDLAGGSPSRFTFDPGRSSNPVWSPDGSRIVFSLQSQSTYSSDLIVKPANGAGKEEVLLHAGVNGSPTDWSRDGKLLVYNADHPSTDLWMIPLDGERKPVSFLQTPFAEGGGHFSPDAKFLVYQSDESGQSQIYVQPVPPNGSKWQVSKEGGRFPTWRRDGKEIFYATPDQKLMAVPVKTEPAFEAGTPQALFESGEGFYVPSADGQRFLVVVPAGGEAAQAPALTVVTHWQSELKK